MIRINLPPGGAHRVELDNDDDVINVGTPPASPTGPIPATQVTFNPEGTSLSATNAQEAIKEVANSAGQIDPDLLLIYTIAKET